MANSSLLVEGLTPVGCRLRQKRLVEQLQAADSDAILICDRRHVYYFCGFWAASYHAPLLLVNADGSSHLVLPDIGEEDHFVASNISHYQADRMGTLADDQFALALAQLSGKIASIDQLGIDLPGLVLPLNRPTRDLSSLVLSLRRAKREDEIVLIRHAIRACEAAYAKAAEILRPGVREIDVYAEMQAAAVKEIGEPIGEMGNDFQSGSSGGPPRIRCVERGELMPLDVSVTLRGYRCDLCRTSAIGHQPSDLQRKATEMVNDALRYFEESVRLGDSCRALYEKVKVQLDDPNGWRFPHHLGHGIGLGTHEAPRLNPHWDDFLKQEMSSRLSRGCITRNCGREFELSKIIVLLPMGFVACRRTRRRCSKWLSMAAESTLARIVRHGDLRAACTQFSNLRRNSGFVGNATSSSQV